MKLDQNHFQELLECHRAIEALYARSSKRKNAWIGNSAKRWYATAAREQSSDYRLTDRALGRSELADLVTEYRSSPLEDRTLQELIITVLAWGKLSYARAPDALRSMPQWQHVCRQLLEHRIDVFSAYQAFYNLHHGRQMAGIGPAYYTKLIFFFGGGEGLIMDQWTSKSTNILFGEEVVRLDGDYVSRFADQTNYRNYIRGISLISERLGLAGATKERYAATEELIFSISAKKRPATLNAGDHEVLSRWRKYVTGQFHPARASRTALAA